MTLHVNGWGREGYEVPPVDMLAVKEGEEFAIFTGDLLFWVVVGEAGAIAGRGRGHYILRMSLLVWSRSSMRLMNIRSIFLVEERGLGLFTCIRASDCEKSLEFRILRDMQRSYAPRLGTSESVGKGCQKRWLRAEELAEGRGGSRLRYRVEGLEGRSKCVGQRPFRARRKIGNRRMEIFVVNDFSEVLRRFELVFKECAANGCPCKIIADLCFAPSFNLVGHWLETALYLVEADSE
jgi:hypothetical protein